MGLWYDECMNPLTISTGTLVKIVLVAAAAWLLYTLRDVVIIMLTAVVIASAIEPATKWCVRNKIPRTLGVILVYILFLGAVFGILYLFVPIFLSEATGFIAEFPRYLEYVRYIPEEYAPLLEATNANPTAAVNQLLVAVKELTQGVAQDVFKVISVVFGGVLSFILIFVFSFYFSIQERGIEDFLRIVTPVEHENYVIDLWSRAQQKIGLWMQGQLILAVIVGVLVYLGLTILGVKYALVLAVVAGLFEIIPVFGPTLSAIPAVLVGFGDGGVTIGLLVVALYVIIQQFENHLIYPLVVTKVVGVPPLLVILGLIIGAKLAGVLGIILSAPVAAVLQELISDHDKGRRRGSVAGT